MKRKQFLVWGFVIVTCVGAYWLGSSGESLHPWPKNSNRLQNPVIDGLAVEVQDLEVGEVWEDDRFGWDLPIRNKTQSDIEIADFSLSCACLDVQPRKLTVPAGKTVRVRLVFDLTKRTQGELGQTERPFAFEVTPITTKGRFRGPGWELCGTVKSRVTLDTTVLNFGEVLMDDPSVRSRKVIAQVHVPAERLEAEVDPTVAMVEVVRRLEGTGRFEVVIAPQPSLSTGRFESKVVFSLVTSEGERFFGTKLTIAGQVPRAIRMLPARIQFGVRKIGDRVESDVLLQGPTSVALMVERMETDSPDVTIEAVDIPGVPPGRTFRITQQITREGEQASIARFVVRKAGQLPITVPMEVCYYGQVN